MNQYDGSKSILFCIMNYQELDVSGVSGLLWLRGNSVEGGNEAVYRRNEVQSDHYSEVQPRGWLAGPLRQIKATAGTRNLCGTVNRRDESDKSCWRQREVSGCNIRPVVFVTTSKRAQRPVLWVRRVKLHTLHTDC